MKITFRQAGGFAGLVRGCELDTASMPTDEAARLEKLLEESGLKGMTRVGPEGARDLATYMIAVETPQSGFRATFDDMTMPQEAEPLLEYLQQRAKPLAPR